jgi:hypothetical protein
MADPDDDIVNPLGLDITDEVRALSAAMAHMPDRDEITSLLVTYFVGPISDAVVDRIEKRFHEADEDRGLWMSHHREFESPTRWRGKAWNEEFTFNRTSMTPRDHVLLIANMTADRDPSFPRPKMYCPEPFIGTWRQVEPETSLGEPVLWHLAADGSFRCNSPTVSAEKTGWRIERGGIAPRVLLALGDERSWGWSIHGIKPSLNEIAGTELGYLADTPYRLVRAVPILRLGEVAR